MIDLKQLRQVIRPPGILDREADDGALVSRRRPVDLQAGDLLQSLGGVPQQRLFVRMDVAQTMLADVIDGGSQRDGLCDRQRAGFEFGRQFPMIRRCVATNSARR